MAMLAQFVIIQIASLQFCKVMVSLGLWSNVSSIACGIPLFKWSLSDSFYTPDAVMTTATSYTD